MLKSLLIENYALIEKLDISFDEGLTIVTGETGAGKSILLGALNLILGQRADTKVLFSKEKKCIIEGAFFVHNLPLKALFEENELDYDKTAIFRREITPQGKSRAFINDTPVNLNVMKLFAEKLIDIHSQHESLIFNRSAFRYHVTDAWAGTVNDVNEFRTSFQQLNSNRKKLESLLEQEKQTRADLDYFRFQYDELYKANLQPGELDELESELEVLNNVEEIKFNLEKADFMLQESPENTLGKLGELQSLFSPLERYDKQYAELLQRITSINIELKDIASEIASVKENVSGDPARSNQLQQRYDLLQKLIHKHNATSVDELMEIRDSFLQRIESFESLETDIQQLEEKCSMQEDKLQGFAQKISAARKKAIPALEKEINALLKELGMPNGRFLVKTDPSTDLHANGLDELYFLFSANMGSEPQDISKVASGGEMSRLMLAVKSVISMKNLLPTIIFDEIDTGVSGEIGFKMGHILEKIAHNMQVVCVTHLPQVAARGHKHFIVYKTIRKNAAHTLVQQVNEKERVEEIAKMLGGETPSSSVMQTAEELITNKSVHKS